MNRLPVPRTPPPPHAEWISSEALGQIQASGTTAHRLYSSPDTWLERFGEDALISYQHPAGRDAVLAELPAFSDEHGLRWRRIFGKTLPRQNEDRAAPVLLRGAPGPSLETVVEENGMKFALDFGAGYSAGLFVDQRANRAHLRQMAVRRVLNTFAYTCSFSVAAALSGAETTSIDLSKKSIERGRENFALNQIDPARHRFYADDVLEMLPRLARKGERFDAIVLDPPTFSRGTKGRKFQVEHDMENLLLAALEVAAPRARLLLSTNCTRMNRPALEAVARHCLKMTRQTASFHHEPTLPDIPPEFAAQTLWLTLRS